MQSPQNPFVVGNTANLRASNGFEGMAINSSGDKLYPLLEGSQSKLQGVTPADSSGAVTAAEIEWALAEYGREAVAVRYDLDAPEDSGP